MNLNLNKEAAQFSEAVVVYEVANGLPPNFFQQPDHMAVATADINEFEEFSKLVTKVSERAFCFEQEDRFVVLAQLAGAVTIGPQGKVRWLEIKEPPKEGPDIVGLEHVEFYFRDLQLVDYILRRKELEHEIETEGNHQRISLPLTDEGQQLRLSNTPAQAIAYEKLQNGEAYRLKAA